MAREGLVGRGGSDRAGRGRGRDGRVSEAWTGPAGRVEDGARARRVIRRQDAPDLVRVGRLLRRSSSWASRTCAGRSRCGTSTCSSCLVHGLLALLRARRDLRVASHSPIPCSRTCSPAACGSASPAARRARGSSGRRGRSPPSRCSCSGFASASTRDAPRRHRRRAGGSRRRGSHPRRRGAVREHAARGRPRAVRTGGRGGPVRERIQTNGRCEAAIERGDTYGPVSYLGYVPAVSSSTGAGSGTRFPRRTRRRSPSTCWRVLGLVLVGLRFGGGGSRRCSHSRWTAYPFTAYTLNANTNDTIMPAFLIFGFWLVVLGLGAGARGRTRRLDEVRRTAARAALGGLPEATTLRRLLAFGVAFARATVAAFCDPPARASAVDAVRTFWERTSGTSRHATRRSRSGAGVSTTREGIPDLGFLQPVVAVACGHACAPRRGSCRGGRARSSSPH